MNFLLFLFFTILHSETNYKEPDFILLDVSGGVEIREYGEYIVAKTSVPLKQKYSENNMFRTLASYIFGDNQKKQNIPMTAPVTTFKNIDSYDMLFYMLESDSINHLPKPSGQNITFEKFNLGKCAVISFSVFGVSLIILYSSISQMGFIFAAISNFTFESLIYIYIYFFIYILNNIIFFIIIMILLNFKYENKEALRHSYDLLLSSKTSFLIKAFKIDDIKLKY